MTRLPGEPADVLDSRGIAAMAEMLTTVHDVRPTEAFRTYQSWAWEAKRVVPAWTRHPRSWRRAFEVLAEDPPSYEPTFLHRDFSHRNLLWRDGLVSGLVDWVETSTGPAWLDAGHAASNLAIAFGPEPARLFLDAYTAVAGRTVEPYWLVMDAVGFLPPPGKEPMFASAAHLAGLDAWVAEVVRRLDR